MVRGRHIESAMMMAVYAPRDARPQSPLWRWASLLYSVCGEGCRQCRVLLCWIVRDDEATIRDEDARWMMFPSDG